MTTNRKLAWFVGIAAALLVAALVGLAALALTDRTITYDAWLFEGTDDADVRASFDEQGCTSAVKNEDGSWTVVMPPDKYEEYVTECKDSVQKILDELVESEDWPNIADVTYDKDFTEVTITLRTDELELTDVFAPVAVGLSAFVYQEARGLPASCHIVTMGASGSQLSEVTYPQAAAE